MEIQRYMEKSESGITVLNITIGYLKVDTTNIFDVGPNGPDDGIAFCQVHRNSIKRLIQQMFLMRDNHIDVKLLLIPQLLPTNRSNPRDSRKQREPRKMLRNMGKEYTTKKCKVIKERVMRPLPLCRSKCKDKIPEDDRNKLFHQYWSLDDYDKRFAYISSLFVIENKKATRPRIEDPEK
ncbi:unnamed protein product [Psylliodes chrysocephalus]|uniref:Uncharacterized protein n=1 Tax=Psylliodes chrysocephalus TaxID=3402493 RepID=A0A9P0GBR5_9CUCU|nr:unnamed protein product [Psylliodes chrysocephala]